MKRYLIILFFFSLLAHAQENKEKKAANNYRDFAFADAIASYQSLVDKGYSNEEIYMNLGNANYFNAQYKEAAEWYEKLLQLESESIDAEYMYRYAQSLKSQQDYAASDQWMQKFKDAKAADQRAIKYEKNTDYLDKIEAQSGRYDLKNLTINSKESDFAPSFHNDKLVFSTARDSGITGRKLHRWNNKSFLELYVVTIDEEGNANGLTKLHRSINSKAHESSTAFTRDGNTVYFTRNNSRKGSFTRDKEGVSRLMIYKAVKKNGKWRNIKALPFNSDDYSTAHPSLSPDGKKLYFSSDMPGTYGASDIYVVDILEDGSYGTPRNLGPEINTESRESYPFISDSNVLYFASDGHPGLGGLDIFATKLEDPDNYYVVNVGKVVNSPMDDYSYIVDENSKIGYFASNRFGGEGSDDIYQFTENAPIDLDCNTKVSGIVTDRNSGEILPDSHVRLFNSSNEQLQEARTANDGTFLLEGSCKNGSYQITAESANYEMGERTFTLVDAADTNGLKITLVPINQGAPKGTELIAHLNLKPVYFDFDKAFIRDDARTTLNAIVAYLNEFPAIKITIGSHTDSRANDAYNQVLSLKRAQETRAYLIDHGISGRRLTAKGYGETQLTNNCSNGVACSKQEHQMNRRSEFIVIE